MGKYFDYLWTLFCSFLISWLLSFNGGRSDKVALAILIGLIRSPKKAYLILMCLKCLKEYMQVTLHRNMFTMLSSQVWLAGGG